MSERLNHYINIIKNTKTLKVTGKVIQVVGLVIEGEVQGVSIGEVCHVYISKSEFIRSEVVGFKEEQVLLMPFGSIAGIKPGSLIEATGSPIQVKVGPKLLGRVLDGIGEPMDNKGDVEYDALFGIDNEITPANFSALIVAAKSPCTSPIAISLSAFG